MNRHPWRDVKRAFNLARSTSELPGLPDEALPPILLRQCPRCSDPFKVGDIILYHHQLVEVLHMHCLTRAELEAIFGVGYGTG